MTTPPFDLDAAFGSSNSAAKKEELEPNQGEVDFDYNTAFGGTPAQKTAEKFISAVQSDIPLRVPTLTPFNPEILNPRPKPEVTKLPAGREAEFATWLNKNKVEDLDAPESHYDYRGAFMAGINRGPSGHWPDTFKQHGHPTFSNESQYANGDGGTWAGDTFIPPISAMPRMAADVTAQKEERGRERYRPGEGRADFLRRRQEEYNRSPQKIVDDLRNDASIKASPEGNWDKFKSVLANTRLFTDRSIVEFNAQRDSGFSIGQPFVHPVETAKGLVMGLPHFFLELVRQPFVLAIDRLEPGSGYLLPEERAQYQKEVAANYAGLIMGGAMGSAYTEMKIGRDILKSGVSKALAEEATAKTVTAQELALIGDTDIAAARMEGSLLGKIQRGVVEGATGGATTGFIAGRTPKERRDLAASYAIMALPAGIAFEAGKSIIHGDAAGPNTQIARDARTLSIIRQVQDASMHNADDAVASFFALNTAGDMAEAVPHMELDRPIIVQGVARAHEVVGSEAFATHLRPDGTYDVAYGPHDYGESPVEVTPEVGSVREMSALQMPDDVLKEQVAELLRNKQVGTERFSELLEEAGRRFGDATEHSPEVQKLGEQLDNAMNAVRIVRSQAEDHPALPALEATVEKLGKQYRDAVRTEQLGPVSYAKTGEGTVGTSMDKSLLKKLGANLYKGTLGNTIVKEGIQNAIDAIRPTGGKGRVLIDADPYNGKFKFTDTGVGMTPEVAANQFMDVGGSAKSEGSAGGYGLAKVGLLSNAEHFEMVSVAETPNGKKRTSISGSSDDWVNGTLKYKVEDVARDTQTGTTLDIKVPGEMTAGASWEVKSFVENVRRFSRADLPIDVSEKGNFFDPRTTREPVVPGETLNLKNAEVEITHSPAKEELGQYESMEVHVLNNGLYQFTTNARARGVVPKFITVDVKSKVGVDAADYPFTTSREELKSGVDKAVKEYIDGIAITAAKEEAYGLIGVLRDSPKIPGGGDLRVMDTSMKISKEVIRTVLEAPSTKIIAKGYEKAIKRIAEVMQNKLEQISSTGSRGFTTFKFGGLGVGKGYLGLNVSSEALNNVARAAKLPDTGMKDNVILVNPFSTYKEVLHADAMSPDSGISLAERMADHTIGTLVHEIVHEVSRGHDEYFAGALTRAIGVVLEEAADAHLDLSNMWNEVLKDEPTISESIFTGANSFDQVYRDVIAAWKDGEDAFKSISSHLTPEDNARSLERGNEAGNEPRTNPGDSEVSEPARTGPPRAVRPSEALSGGEGDSGAGAGAAEAQRAAYAKSYFGASGFFPEETVSFLGKDYQHHSFTIGKDSNVESHILRDADGNKIVVPRDMVQHGSDMLVNSILLDRPAAQKALFKKFKDFADASGDQPFDQVVQSYMNKEGLRTNQYAAIRKFLSDRYGEALRNEHLTPREKVTYKRITTELNSYSQKSAATLADQATANGMYVESYAGSLRVRDSQTGEILGKFQNVPDATNFVNSVVSDKMVDLTPGNGGGLPPDGINRGLMSVPPGAGGPHTSTYNFINNGVLGQMRDWFNTTALGQHVTGMRAIMNSLDNLLGTELFGKVYSPLQIATQRKFGAMYKDMKRLSTNARIARGLSMDELEQVTSSLETMAPDDMVQPGGLFKNRAFTDREIEGAKWFVDHQIDIKKAFAYRRALIALERKRGFSFAPEGDKVNAVRKLQASLNVDEAHVEAARVIGAVLNKNTPGELSIYGIVRLADALMDGHTTPEKFMDKNNFTPQMRKLREELKSHFGDLAETFQIPEEQQLGGYFSHLRNYKDNEIFVGADNTPVFVSELMRTGELSEYDRDPINVMARYINMGYTSKFTAEHIDNAYSYVNQTMAKLTREGKLSPKEAEKLNQLITDNYINELRGVPHASTSFSERMFNGILSKLGVETSVSVRRDLVNTFLSLSSSAAIGFKPVQGIRDFHNLTSIYYSRFGAERTGALMTIMSRVTPDELIAAGILKNVERGEGIPSAMAREGMTPTLSPVSVLTAQERLQNTLSGKTQPYREAIQKAADAGIKWGLQHNVYQWAHAASYLESSTRALRELNKLSLGEYGTGDGAKQKAYDNLFINSYDLPVAREFDRMVTEGKFKEAADLLGRATSFETVSTFGLANHPVGWGTNTGRLFGQFGNWPVWARTTLGRMLTRGTRAERTRVAVRFGATQGSLALASSALGLNLNSWMLPGAAPLFSAGQHLAAASQSYDDDESSEILKAAAAITLGVPGSALFRGGPAVGIAAAAVDAGQGFPAGENEAVRALTQAPLLAVPGSFLLRDIYEGVQMSEEGMNPVSVWLRAFGVRSTDQESLLNP